MKITSEIHQVGGGAISSAEDAAVYLIHFEGHAALVDAGCGNATRRILANIKECGILPEGIEYLLITHCHFDHTGGAKALREATGCRVIAHELDAIYMEKADSEVTAASWYGSKMNAVPVDRRISGSREEIQLGERSIEAIHTPGHSPGSMVYLTESEGMKILFAQDVHGPLHPSLLSRKRDYVSSLNLLISLEADILCEGHYGVIRGGSEVTRFIRSFL